MCHGLGSDRSSWYRKGKGFAHGFGKFLVTCCCLEQHSAPLHLWKAQTCEDLTFPRGRLRENLGVPSEPPGRMEVVEGRRGDSEEGKGEKEGKDRERKVDLGREVLHTCGLPGWTAPCSRASQSRGGVATWRGLPQGSQLGDIKELPPLSPWIWSLPRHQHKMMRRKKT